MIALISSAVIFSSSLQHQDRFHLSISSLSRKTNSKHPPSQFISVQVTDESGNVRLELQPNKEYQKWKKSDQIMLFWLISTLSQKVVGQVTKCKSSLEAWSKLENLYSQKSMTIRKGSHSVSDFVLKIKNIGDVLSAAGEEVSERDLLLSLMHGVGHEYDAVVVLISSQRMTMSLEEAQFLLLMHEQRIEQLNSPNNFGGISANFVTNNAGDKRDHRGGSNYNRGGQRGRGRGGRFGGRKLYCQLCTKPGHHAFQPQPSHYTNNNSHSAAAPNQAYIGQSSHNSDQQNTVSQVKTALSSLLLRITSHHSMVLMQPRFIPLFGMHVWVTQPHSFSRK
ncbi:hypothetical protein ACOSQ3_002689 [Xanthoceras sorbifolium]